MTAINRLILWLRHVGLGLLVIGLILFWLDWQTEKRVAAARAEGKAQCEAEFARNEVKKIERKKAVQNERNFKKTVIWSEPNVNRNELLKLMCNSLL